MEFLIKYTCNSLLHINVPHQRIRETPVTLLSIDHKGRVISEWSSCASLKKKKTTLKESCNFSDHHKELWCGSLLTYLLGCFLTYFWEHEKQNCFPSFWRENTKVTGFVFMEQYSCLWRRCQSEWRKSHDGRGVGDSLKWTSSEILSESSNA